MNKCIKMHFSHYRLFLLIIYIYFNTSQDAESRRNFKASHLSFEPKKGPYKGGTNITILSRNLGEKFSNINITIGKVPCQLYKRTFEPNKKIICQVGRSFSRYYRSLVVLNVGNLRIYSNQSFQFVDPQIKGISPGYGSIGGNTILIIKGMHLDAGNTAEVFIANISCPILLINSTCMKCVTNPSKKPFKGIVVVKIDHQNIQKGRNITYEYKNLKPGINKVKNKITKKTTSEFTPNFNSSSDRKNHTTQKKIKKTSVAGNNETSQSKNQKTDEDLSKEKDSRFHTNTSHTLTSAYSQHLKIIFICCLIAILLLTVLISIVTCFSLRKKANILKHRTFQTSQKKVTFSRWKKKLNLEKPSIGDANSSFDSRLPRITIQRYAAPQILFKNVSSKIEYDLPFDEKWEFSRNVLTLGECLATSECSEVLKGKAFGILEKHTFTDVAVKKLKDHYNDKDIINLTLKMEAMKLMGSHENVLRLLGCCTQFGDLYLLTEYAPYGNLRDFLLQHRHPLTVAPPEVDLTENTLLSFAQQIAEGMKYLNSIKFIHRTLSARNILVFKGYTMKIGDFGLAKDITEHDFYEKSTMYKLPIKWMAPEVLFKKICTSKSDVWSYGVLLWEIFSFGEEPCTVFRNIEHFFSELRTGFRLEKPLYCSLKTYCLMHSCWNSVPEDRPTFIEILKSLEEILLASGAIANQ